MSNAIKGERREDAMVFEKLNVSREGQVLFVEISAPPMNLLGPELVRDLLSLIQQAEADETVQVLVFKSSDHDYFIAHVDVTRIKENREAAAKLSGDPSIGQMLRYLSASRLVSIAQIEGRVRGVGSEFVLAARESAIFGQFEPAFGVIPGAGGAQHLTRLMGRGRALEVMLSAQDYDAGLAERYGWINRALPADEIDEFVRSLAHRIAKFPAAGHAVVKERGNAITLPSVEDIRRDSDLFLEGTRTNEFQELTKAAMKRGFQTRADEMDLARLSYTTFSYSGLRLPKNAIKPGDPLTVELTVTNTGKRDGDEVAQLYLSFPNVPGAALRALRGFKRIHLKPGEAQKLRFELKERDLSMVSEEGEAMIVQGQYSVSIGGGQPDSGAPTVAGTFQVKGTKQLPE
jgi:enoyl-CoA hydratase/carnithine racemase